MQNRKKTESVSFGYAKPSRRTKPFRIALIVAGMHRSGTSSVAGSLVALGCNPPVSLMPADELNPRGYWESFRIKDFNDEILNSAGSFWNDWRAFNGGWYDTPLLNSYRKKAIKLINEEYSDSHLFVLKDPRICRLLPFWNSIFNEMKIDTRILLPIRSPIEVAKSLAHRNGFSFNAGLLIWLRHVLDAELNSRANRRVIFDWNNILNNLRNEIDFIANELDIVWPRKIDFAYLDLKNFISKNLKNQNDDNEEIQGFLADQCKNIFEILVSRNIDHKLKKELDKLRIKFDIGSEFFGPILSELERQHSTNILEKYNEAPPVIRFNSGPDSILNETSDCQRLSDELSATLEAERGARQLSESEIAATREALALAEQRANAEAEERQRLSNELSATLEAERGARQMNDSLIAALREALAMAEQRANAEAEERQRLSNELSATLEAERGARQLSESDLAATREALALAEQRANAEAEERQRLSNELSATLEAERGARQLSESELAATREALALAEQRANAEAEERQRLSNELSATLEAERGARQLSESDLAATREALALAEQRANAEAEERQRLSNELSATLEAERGARQLSESELAATREALALAEQKANKEAIERKLVIRNWEEFLEIERKSTIQVQKLGSITIKVLRSL